MSKPLPTETLQQIFSSDLAQHHLSPLCLVDRRISEIVKPYIYDSITIQSQKQLEQFRKQAQNENVELVRSARIVGKRDPWEIRSVPELVHYFKNMAGSMLREEKEAGCVKMLIEGDLVDENQLQSIHIYNVAEDPTVLWKKGFKITPQIFANLVDLSIISLRGGLNIIPDLLRRRYLPNLERLAICDVSYSDEAKDAGIFDTTLFETTGEGFPFPARTPSDHDCLEMYLEESDLFESSKLKLLVSPPYGFQEDYPSLFHLPILTSRYPILPSEKYAVVFISSRAQSSIEIDLVFNQLDQVAANFHLYSLRYLAIPPRLPEHLSTAQKRALDDLANLGVVVGYDGGLGCSIAPPSFFEFRKKEEAEKATKM